MIINAKVKKGGRLFSFFVLFILLAPNAQAIEYSSLGGRPAFPREDNPRTSSIFIHTLEPGQTQADGVNVINNTAETKTILVYASDSTASTGGAFACKQFSQAKEDVGAWVDLERTELVLESGGSVVVPFMIKVPANASVGEHNGCILVQEKKEASTKAGVNISTRTGLRIALTIPGEIVRQLEVAGFQMDSSKAKYVLQPEVKNTGNVSIDADINIRVANVLGFTYEKLAAQYPIFRGETASWNFELARPFWGGLYRANLSVAYDQSAEASVGVRTGGELTEVKGRSIWFFSFPSMAGLLIEILVLALIAFCLYILLVWRKRKQWMQTAWLEHQVSANEDINKLAKEYNIAWNLIAKANKLKPPYTLTVGEKIKVPPKDK